MRSVANAIPDKVALGYLELSLPATSSSAALDAVLDQAVAQAERWPRGGDAIKTAVRDMLRRRHYKPTGRRKPASEYLAKAAREGRFPRISPAVDALNVVSLRSGLPISMWDWDLVAGARMHFRLGAEDERYAFNAAGQVLALRDLVCGYGTDGETTTPHVSPIKDSHQTKVSMATRAAGLVVYAPRTETGQSTLERAMTELSELYQAIDAEICASTRLREPPPRTTTGLKST